MANHPGNAGGNGGSGGGNSAWSYVMGTGVVSVLTALIYQVHGCSAHTPQPTPTVAETTTQDTEEETPSTPAVSAHVDSITSIGTDRGNTSYWDEKVVVSFTGLQGQDCTVKWVSYYPDGSGQGGTDTGYSGKKTTGLLPYDPTEWTDTIAMNKAEYSGWRVHIFVYGPDGTLLTERDGPTG
ncbi:hypothetical protein [Streptomyces sp. HPF1205]|uniref:hypothetical protein n=1 Tax=Streptomyces sp. HPF1205 TaxID=2873262 RepID=UPI001CED9AD8|nr:hypothetical protein [Streptomyces sp. HPF1205]